MTFSEHLAVQARRAGSGPIACVVDALMPKAKITSQADIAISRLGAAAPIALYNRAVFAAPRRQAAKAGSLHCALGGFSRRLAR